MSQHGCVHIRIIIIWKLQSVFLSEWSIDTRPQVGTDADLPMICIMFRTMSDISNGDSIVVVSSDDSDSLSDDNESDDFHHW